MQQGRFNKVTCCRPISLFCVEGLLALIRRAEESHRLTGIAISRGGPRISHLFFTNDSLLFGVAKLEEILVIQEILQEYKHASGQKINLDKSAIYFSANVDNGCSIRLLN
ncbi:hypothetical protein ACSBR1_026955 [Camellia fascicularis]